MTPELLTSIKYFAPEWILIGGLTFLFVLDAVLPSSRTSKAPLWIVLFSCVLGILVSIGVVPKESTSLFSGLMTADGLTTFFRVLFFFACGAGVYLAYQSDEVPTDAKTEFSLLVMCITFGMSLMASAANLLTLYIGIETVSIVSFVLAGLRRDDIRSSEASLKYMIFGATASALMIYGFSLIYGLTGALGYREISAFLAANQGAVPMALLVALVLTYAGLAYKISAFPMHFWTPDVYEGSPTPVTAFFSIAPKAAGFAATIRVFLTLFSSAGPQVGAWSALTLTRNTWVPMVALVSVLTMFVGNLSALGQRNVKRILAYSSIAHVGYILSGLISVNGFGVSAILFYILAYYLMNLGAFWCVSIIADRKKSEDLDAFKGVGWEDPVLGVCMAVFLFSLTGIPLFSGFIGKFLLFSNIVQTPGYLWVAVFGVLNSVISLFYYANILKAMWLEKPATVQPAELSLLNRMVLVGLALPTVILGLYFGPALRLTQSLVATFK